MTQKILRLPAVKELTGISRASIYAFMKAGTFPASYVLGARSIAISLKSAKLFFQGSSIPSTYSQQNNWSFRWFFLTNSQKYCCFNSAL